MTIPASLFAEIFEQLNEKILINSDNCTSNKQKSEIQKNFSVVWIADGSTLEQLRGKLKLLKNNMEHLGGRIMMIVEAFSHNPISYWYTCDSTSNDKIFAEKLLNKLPRNGLLIFDLGFFSFKWSCYEKIKSTLLLV